MIEAEYTITYADYKSALRLYYRRRPLSIFGLIIIYGVAVFFTILLAFGLWGRFHGGPNELFAGNGSIAANALFVFFYPLLRTLQLRKCYRALFPAGSQRKIVLTASDEQLVVAIPGTAESRYFWNAFQDFGENKNGMILFVNKRRFVIVPRHAFNEAQWLEFRSLVAEKTKHKELAV